MVRTLISLLLLLPVAAYAQAPATPAVERPQTPPAGNQTGDAEQPGDASQTDSIDPAVPTSVLAQDRRSNSVMDEIVLERSEITGNQELPKVLYIVPWQKSDPGDLTGKPVNTLLDEVLAPIDRSEFIRQVDYYGELYGNDQE